MQSEAEGSTDGTERTEEHTETIYNRQYINDGDTECTDRLEDYLNHIYEKKCIFGIDKEEVQFIQNAVETFVRLYMDEYYIRMNYFDDDTCCIKHHYPELLKVGSFYEHTKNRFPNEFDFLLVIGYVTELPDGKCSKAHYLKPAETPFKFQRNKDSFLEFHHDSYKGPANTYTFLYHKGTEIYTIDVDVTVAVRCSWVDADNVLKESEVLCGDFYQRILETGSILLIYYSPFVLHEKIYIHGPWKFSVTETEMTFMKQTLSVKHRKAYRILKFLINNRNERRFRNVSKEFSFCISSYNIKSALINHHYSCERSGSAVAHCVLDVLEYFNDKLINVLRRQPIPGFVYITGQKTVHVQQDLLINCKYSTRKFVEDKEDRTARDFQGIFTYGLQARLSNCIMISGSREKVGLALKYFKHFIKRLNLLRQDRCFFNCEHGFTDSFLDILYNVPTFQKYVKEFEEREEQPPATEDEASSEDQIPKCKWCDYCTHL